jgi:hypothetical protein
MTMTDGFPPADWFPWPETWPSWMPNALRDGGLGPPVRPREPHAWPTFGWEQGSNGGAIGHPNKFGEQFDPYWWESITPTPPDIGTSGLLGHLLAPRDAVTGGLLGNLGTPRDSGGGLLGDLGARRGSGNGGLLGHLSAPPAGPPAFDRGPDIEGAGPWGWPKLRIPSGLSPTVSPTPLPPPASSIDSWKQDESISLDRGRFNWVETPNGGLLALHPNGNDVDWVETPSGGLLAVPKPQINPSWLRSAIAFGTNPGTSAVPAPPSAQPMEIPSYDDAASAKLDSPALPEPSALPPILPPAPPGMWNDSYRSQMPFDANAGSPGMPAPQDERLWPDPSLTDRDQTAIQPPPLGLPQLPPMASQASPDVGRDFHWRQMPFDANVRIPAVPAHDQLWPDAALGMRDQSRWGFPTLPSPTVMPPHATNSNSISDHDLIIDRTAIASDADPETWIAGLRYANRSGRGARGPGIRQPSPAEENLLWFYGSAHRTLRELDPTNRQLPSLSSEAWIPRQEDINRLNEEIARVRRERGLSDLERHHTLPQEFALQFEKAGIDIRDHIVYLARNQHRLLPNGLHTGSEHWNAQWRQFFERNKLPNREEVLEKLNEMLKQIPR